MSKNKNDAEYLSALLDPLKQCMHYKPAFGTGRGSGVTFEQFEELYGADPFYSWLGLQSPDVYAAHKAAGGLTSVYRQLGIGVERLFRLIVSQSLGLDDEQLRWSYEYLKPDGKNGVHTLDARVTCSDLTNDDFNRVQQWLDKSLEAIGRSNTELKLGGGVFEVRQGYKSADSKRQNADLRFGMRAYQESLLPVVAIMSSQVSLPVVNRYRTDGMLVLTGVLNGDETVSTYSFFRNVVGYDLAALFERNSETLANEVNKVVKALLSAET